MGSGPSAVSSTARNNLRFYRPLRAAGAFSSARGLILRFTARSKRVTYTLQCHLAESLRIAFSSVRLLENLARNAFFHGARKLLAIECKAGAVECFAHNASCLGIEGDMLE
jgi:hypothetical protein